MHFPERPRACTTVWIERSPAEHHAHTCTSRPGSIASLHLRFVQGGKRKARKSHRPLARKKRAILQMDRIARGPKQPLTGKPEVARQSSSLPTQDVAGLPRLPFQKRKQSEIPYRRLRRRSRWNNL